MKMDYLKLSLFLYFLFFSSLSFADQEERLVLQELEKIASLYADGYAKLDKESLQVKLVYKDKEGECTLIGTFKMTGFSAAANFTQFVGFFNCPTFRPLIKSNRKLFLSDLYRFYVGEPELDISKTIVDGNLIKIEGISHSTKRPVVAVFEPSGGPGWWRLKQVQGMAEHEVLSGK